MELRRLPPPTFQYLTMFEKTREPGDPHGSKFVRKLMLETAEKLKERVDTIRTRVQPFLDEVDEAERALKEHRKTLERLGIEIPGEVRRVTPQVASRSRDSSRTQLAKEQRCEVVIEVLSGVREGLRLADIAKRVGASTPTIAGDLKLLMAEGKVVQKKPRGPYKLAAYGNLQAGNGSRSGPVELGSSLTRP